MYFSKLITKASSTSFVFRAWSCPYVNILLFRLDERFNILVSHNNRLVYVYCLVGWLVNNNIRTIKIWRMKLIGIIIPGNTDYCSTLIYKILYLLSSIWLKLDENYFERVLISYNDQNNLIKNKINKLLSILRKNKLLSSRNLKTFYKNDDKIDSTNH